MNGGPIVVPSLATVSAGMSCPAGKKILFGGVDTSDATSAVISRSFAINSSLFNVAVHNAGSGTITVTPQVICAFAN